MARCLKLDDLRTLNSPDNLAKIFQRLGYDADVKPIDVEDLQLSPKNTEAVDDAYIIANQGDRELQILLFQLHQDEWLSPATASTRMKSIATQVGQRGTKFLLLATLDYTQLLLVNPRQSFDDQSNLKASIRKLLIDVTNPTAYDLDRLEALAVNNQNPQQLYQSHCEAFDVEKLTKSFYKGYKTLFDKAITIIKTHNDHSYFDDNDRLHQFTQRLLGRLMFLYFLQKKEFLGEDRKFLTTQYQLLRTDPENTDYYQQVLEPLFFDTLNVQRPDFQSQWGKIPYLNGGLFDRDYGVNIKDAIGRETPETVTIPNELFDPGDPHSVLGFFNSYNFTITENTAGDEDVAVDPEMLGKVFENLLAAEERGQSGTFYTPRGIVQFMCSQVLSRYLADETGMELERVQQLIDYDTDVSDSEIKGLMSPNEAKQLKSAINSLKVLDPAVGSGAFPLGMLQVILNVKQAIARREGIIVQRGSLAISQWKREIIENNLFGVDIKPEAIEIAKLRMFLSLVVDIPTIDNVEPLPNLDYKLMCGDSLISTINGQTIIPIPGQVQQLSLGLDLKELDRAIITLIDLEKAYFHAQSQERATLREEILAAEKAVFEAAILDQKTFIQQQQKELEREIKQVKKPSKKQLKQREVLESQLADLTAFELSVKSGDRSLNFFQYHLHFRDVFQDKGGFDIVIGNPPYLKIQKIREESATYFKNNFTSASGKFDVYVLFVEKSFDLIKRRGIICYIHPHKFITADYGKGLKNFLDKVKGIEAAIIFGVEQVFDSATTYSGIFTYSYNNQKIKFKHTDIVYLLKENWNSIEYQKDSFHWSFLSSNKSNVEIQLISKIIKQPNQLNKILEGIFQGTVTGGNNIFVLEGEFQGDYFIGVSELLGNEVKLEASLLKPLLLGENIKRYQKPISNKALFYAYYQEDNETKPIPEKILASKYPFCYEYISHFKSILIEKKKKYKMNPVFWYSLHRGRDINMFEGLKILTPQLQNYPNFTLDQDGWYTDGGYCLVLKKQVNIGYKFLLGILNSSVLWFFIKNTSHPYSNNYYYFKTKYLQPFAIPKVTETDKKAIENLVQKCLDAKGVGVEEWEAEIDDIVAHLYGLSEEEMKIIRGV